MVSTSSLIEGFLTPKELAEQLRMHVGTLANWRSHGIGPEFRRMGGKIVYPIPQLRKWLDNTVFARTSEYGTRKET